MHRTASTPASPGTVLDTPLDLAAAEAHVREHPGPVEITVGADRPVGVHLGTLVRRHAGQRLRAAGADPLILRAPVAVDDDIPDEGVIAAVDDALDLARGVGAGLFVLALGGVTHRGRQRQRLYSMLASLVEAASAHGVVLAVQNHTAVDEVAMLLSLLDREFHHGTLDVSGPAAVTAAWDISRSRAAGQADDAAWARVRELTSRAPVLVRGVAQREVPALCRLPDFERWWHSGRVIVLAD